jgi:hypothetical protein
MYIVHGRDQAQRASAIEELITEAHASLLFGCHETSPIIWIGLTSQTTKYLHKGGGGNLLLLAGEGLGESQFRGMVKKLSTAYSVSQTLPWWLRYRGVKTTETKIQGAPLAIAVPEL